MNHDHVLLMVNDVEPPGCESIPAQQVSQNEWKILRSPLYATEVASGDIVKITDTNLGSFEVVQRSGNICVQFYLGQRDADDINVTNYLVEKLSAIIEPLEGRVDAVTPGLISLTIPAKSGFSRIERAIQMATQYSSGAQWQYANVYDPVSGEPLGWWEG